MRIGVLGTAWIAPRAIIEPARDTEGVEVAAVASRSAERARSFASEHSIPTFYGSYAELIEDESLDAIFVPLVNSLHAEWSIAAMRAGRDVLCEKPLASNAAQAREMVEASLATGRILLEAFHWRFHPIAARMIELSRRIGALEEGRAYTHINVPSGNVRFELDLAGGSMMDIGCYAVHWLRTLTGEQPQVLKARATEGPPAVDVELEAELAFPCGLHAVVDCSIVDPKASIPDTVWLKLRGSAGSLEVVNPISAHRGGRIVAHLEDGAVVDESFAGRSTYHYQLEAFMSVVAGEREPLTGGADAIGNMETLDAIYTAAGLPLRQ